MGMYTCIGKYNVYKVQYSLGFQASTGVLERIPYREGDTTVFISMNFSIIISFPFHQICDFSVTVNSRSSQDVK